MFSAFYRLVCASVGLWLLDPRVKSAFYVGADDLRDDDGPHKGIPTGKVVKVTFEIVEDCETKAELDEFIVTDGNIVTTAAT